MLFEKIGTGATIEEAYEDAKRQLNAPEDAIVQQEVLQSAKKKLFGLKTEPAKVKAWYEVKDAPVAPVARTAPAAPKAPVKNETANKPSFTKQTAPAAAPKATAEKKPAVPVDDNDFTAKFLKTIIGGMNITNYTITKEEDGEDCIYNINCGEEDGILIGRRGETLDAIQYLLRLTVNKGIDEDKHRKVSLNVGNYRQKRSDNLCALAEKSARQVLKYGRNIVLEPMNPYERRIIHTAIQGIEGVTSHSIGFDAGRKVVISLEEGVKPTNPSKGGYNNNRGGYNKREGGNNNFKREGGYNNNRGGSKPPYQKREPYKPAQTRAPRKDTAGSLYGKIEVKPDNGENKD